MLLTRLLVPFLSITAACSYPVLVDRSSGAETTTGAGTGFANVRDYGAVGDAKQISDGTTTVNQRTIWSDLAKFDQSDVGKVIWCIGQNVGVVNPLIDVTTIIEVISPTQIVVAGRANDTVANGKCVWGTQDDTEAFVAAFRAASAAPGTQYPGATPSAYLGPPSSIFIPPGGYIVSSRIYNKQDAGLAPAPSLVGSGRASSVLFLTPTMAIPPDGTAVLIQATGSGAAFRDFGVDASNMNYTDFVNEQDLIRFIGLSRFTVDNLEINNVGESSNSESAAINFQTCSYGQVNNLSVQYSPPLSKMLACKFRNSNGMTVSATFCSNMHQSIVIEDNPDRSPTTLPLIFEGGAADECGSSTVACTEIRGHGQVNVFGTAFFGGSGSQGAISVDDGSTLWLSNANVGAFNSAQPSIGLKIARGGTVYAAFSTLRGNTTSVPVHNDGMFIDAGGNEFKNCHSNTCTLISSKEAFEGNPPVGPGSNHPTPTFR